MTAATLRTVEPSMDRLRARLPDLAQMDLPSLEALGRKADRAVDRLRGRPRPSARPWLLIGIVGIVGLIGIVTALALSTWSRRGGTGPWSDDALRRLHRVTEPGPNGFEPEVDAPTVSRSLIGLSATEASLSSFDPATIPEEA